MCKASEPENRLPRKSRESVGIRNLEQLRKLSQNESKLPHCGIMVSFWETVLWGTHTIIEYPNFIDVMISD